MDEVEHQQMLQEITREMGTFETIIQWQIDGYKEIGKATWLMSMMLVVRNRRIKEKELWDRKISLTDTGMAKNRNEITRKKKIVN